MKFYNRSKLNVIFLIPIALAGTGDGCATTSKNAIVAPSEVTELLSDNTVGLVGENVFALTRSDGTMKGLNIKSGATMGKWWINKQGALCADWENDKQEARCDKLQYTSDKIYLWMETKLNIVKGNPKNL